LKKKKSGRLASGIFTAIIVLVMIVGVGIMAYPAFSNWYNSLHQSRTIATLQEKIADTSEADKQKMLEEAAAYNEALTDTSSVNHMTDEQMEAYLDTLDVSGTGIMGYIDIPKQKIHLPIYHEATEAVLQIGVGHLPGTSLPVGGEGTHSVLTGHTGLPSAKLFTDIDQMQIGDTFEICVLDETLTYEVESIEVVLPSELSKIQLEEGRDLVTLVTCTPYGVNTHRLLITGHRVANAPETVAQPSQNWQREELIVTVLLWLPFMILAAGILILVFFVIRHHRKLKRIRQSIKESVEKNAEDDAEDNDV